MVPRRGGKPSAWPKSLAQQLGAPLYLHDLTGRIREVNAQACGLLGYTRDELVRASLGDIEQEHDAEALQALWQYAVPDRPVLLTGRYRRRDGSTVPVQMHSSRLTPVASGLLLTLVHDISAQRRAEQTLRQDVARLRLLVEEAADAYFLVDLEDEIGRILDFNGQTCRSLGYNREELLRLRVQDIEQAWTPAQLVNLWLAMLPEVPYAEKGIHRRKDGSTFPVEVRHRRFDAGGQPRILALVHDLSEHQHAQEALRQANKKLALLLDSSGEGIFGVDTDLRCTFANRAAGLMLGYAPEEMRSRDMHALVHYQRENKEPHPRTRCKAYRAIHEGRSFVGDDEVLWHKDGHAIHADYSASPIWEDGKVTGAVVVFHNLADTQTSAMHMDYLSTHDLLTGALNRHQFERRVSMALQPTDGGATHHVLAYLDVDQLRVINDTYGSAAGDEVLRQLAVLLAQRTRRSDVVGRLGGDEFAVLLTHCSLEQALAVMGHLRDTVLSTRFAWQDTRLTAHISIGLVPFEVETPSYATLLSAAEAACDRAKKDASGGGLRVFTLEDAELAQRRRQMRWVSRISNALEQNRFELYYQSIAPTGDPRARRERFEILVRMRDEAGSIVLPEDFIPAAEHYHVMPTIDRWVVKTTLEWLRANPHVLRYLELCTINLSGTSIGDEGFLQFMRSALAQDGVPRERIVLELTETAAVEDLPRAMHFMQSLRALGCQFALDDFGSGMSSFGYLRNLPVDFIKIAGDFVNAMAESEADAAIVKAINDVGHATGVRTIAESVQNGKVLDRLRRIGVDYVQGYGIAVPRALHDMLTAQTDDDSADALPRLA